jgi:hypothetical protein
MFSKKTWMPALLALVLVSGLEGCRTAAQFEDGEVADTKVHLVAKNESINEMDLYVVANGMPTRVGTVSGLSTRRLELEQLLFMSSDLRVVASPVGGRGAASTGPIMVSRGQTIDFTIRNSLRASTVNIH